MTPSITSLFNSPLGGLTLTLWAYSLAVYAFKKGRCHPLLNPSVWATLLVIAVVLAFKIPPKLYQESSSILIFLLKPATVALAVPLHRYRHALRQHWKPLLISLVMCSGIAVVSSTGLAWCLGASKTVLLSMMPKSITTPIGISISYTLGGVPALTVAFIMLTGLGGALLAPLLFRFLNIRHPIAQGFTLGAVSHGIGTAAAYQLSDEAGAFSGLAMALHGVLAVILFPWIAHLLGIALVY
ncbi:MAG: LrgB family protein [Pseudomonadota bacterium]